MEEKELLQILSKALKISMQRAAKLSKSRSLRLLSYRGLKYIVLRRDIKGFYEGTVIIIGKRGNFRVVPGYPHIKRVLLLSKALNTHFIDNVLVEEKMDGHNTRVVLFEGEIFAITRGGYICPYTTHRLRLKYEKNVKDLLFDLGEDSIVIGEVVGLENPYTRFHYPEAPKWDFFVFDIMKAGSFLPVRERQKLVNEFGLRNVRSFGIFKKSDTEKLFEIIDILERDGREGLVFKDPFNRVEPLKYTTSYININDIRVGMRALFDEGRSFIFPRLLRELFMYYERGLSRTEIEEKAKQFGISLIEPALESIKKYSKEGCLGEFFELKFYDYKVIEEFIDFMFKLGVDFSVLAIEREKNGEILFKGVKWMKETQRNLERILSTGISPMD